MSINPNTWSAAAAAAAIAARKISSMELVTACLDRIAAREPEIGAWTFVERERALAEARARDAERPRGPLHGVPVGIKDIIDTADMPTTYGSPIYARHRPAIDAACVTLIRRAGGIPLGKTVTTEFAYFAPGKTKNPRNPKHTPGGSSSGSAAAVADDMVPVALGTQTAASIVRPATFCGIVGYKPTIGMYTLAGIKPFAVSFDTLGTLTRGVEDAMLMWRVLHADDRPLPARTAPPRIGLCRTPQWAEAEPATVEAFDAAAGKLRQAGAAVTELTLPAGFADLAETHKRMMAFESARAYATEHASHRDQLSPQLAELINLGLRQPASGYLADRKTQDHVRRELAGLMAGYDALLAPAAPGEAPEGLGATGNPVFSRMWTLLQGPSIALPVQRGPRGLPTGIQLVGAYGSDPDLLATGRWAEDAFARL
jgi:Asp-tRNA(Asn)/Glu-tRNA(Gln) amidotransferase A subunit family amidase